MYIRKTIILSSVNGSGEKAVCNIEKQKDKYVGSLRLYNFKNEPNGILALGFLNKDKVVKSGLTYKSKYFYTFQSVEEISLENSSCALMNIIGGDTKPILYGSTNSKTMSDSESRLLSSLNVLDEVLDKEKIENNLNQNGIYLEEQEEIEELIDKEINESCDGKCSNCKYREAFYSNEEQQPVKDDNFFDLVKDQVDELFDRYPKEDILCEIFPNSKWVKIDYENDGNYYVIGILYENEIIKYICYGIPGQYDKNPPEELKGFSKWLPIDTQNPEGYGYWISYQDAESGENIEMNIV